MSRDDLPHGSGMDPFVAGYSKTPLPKKLGLAPGDTAWLIAAPPGFSDYLTEHGVLTEAAASAAQVPDGAAYMHAFVTLRAQLEAAIHRAEAAMARDGMLWISWPKKASKVPTEVSEDTIREVALRGDLVDVKVCAVDAVWSGLKLVIRKERR